MQLDTIGGDKNGDDENDFVDDYGCNLMTAKMLVIRVMMLDNISTKIVFIYSLGSMIG